MEPSSPPQKQGMGVLAWLGIGCGGIILLAAIVLAVVFIKFGPAAKQFATGMQKNPTRAVAEMTVSMRSGELEMIAEDDVNKRYTLRGKKTGELITVYWDYRQNKPLTVKGDFSAIPVAANPPATPN